VGKLAVNSAGEYFQDSQSLMKHKQIRLSLATKEIFAAREQTTKTSKDQRRQT